MIISSAFSFSTLQSCTLLTFDPSTQDFCFFTFCWPLGRLHVVPPPHSRASRVISRRRTVVCILLVSTAKRKSSCYSPQTPDVPESSIGVSYVSASLSPFLQGPLWNSSIRIVEVRSQIGTGASPYLVAWLLSFSIAFQLLLLTFPAHTNVDPWLRLLRSPLLSWDLMGAFAS